MVDLEKGATPSIADVAIIALAGAEAGMAAGPTATQAPKAAVADRRITAVPA